MVRICDLSPLVTAKSFHVAECSAHGRAMRDAATLLQIPRESIWGFTGIEIHTRRNVDHGLQLNP